jgi:uncharacterized repeat protein (TIGR01451 family)
MHDDIYKSDVTGICTGYPVTWTITVTNWMTDPWIDVYLRDILPASESHVSSVPTATLAYTLGNDVYWAMNLDPGETMTITEVARQDSSVYPYVIHNCVRVLYGDQSRGYCATGTGYDICLPH